MLYGVLLRFYWPVVKDEILEDLAEDLVDIIT